MDLTNGWTCSYKAIRYESTESVLGEIQHIKSVAPHVNFKKSCQMGTISTKQTDTSHLANVILARTSFDTVTKVL